MKQSPVTDIQRLEKKLNLINDKLDYIMDAQGIQLKKRPEKLNEEEEKKRKIRERQQQKILQQQHIENMLNQMAINRQLQRTDGNVLREQFGLVSLPSADRIRLYQKTKNPKAFDGLKRKS